MAVEYPQEFKICVCATLGIVALLLVILLPSSFMYVSYNEYVFIKNKFTNTVHTDRVYTNGRYYILPHYEKITFPRDFQRLEFSSLNVADKEEKRFVINVDVYYRLHPDNLKNIYNNFGLNFESQIRSVCESTIKNTTPKFTLQQYLIKRNNITATFEQELRKELSDIYITLEPNKIFIKDIVLEETTIQKYLDITIQHQQNQQKIYEQDAEVIRSDTTRLVEEITANTTITIRQANAQANQLIQIAKANGFKVINSAEGQGLKYAFDLLEIVDTTTKNIFIKLMAIFDNIKNVQLFSEINLMLFSKN